MTTTRIAGFWTLDWWQTSAGSWAADLPAIPGYPKPGGGHYQVELYSVGNDENGISGYGFSLNIVGPTGAVTLWEENFGFGYASTAAEAMQEVESLSPEEIAQAAADKGVQPWADVTASRKGKHMMRKATRRTASMNLDWVNTDEDTWQADLPAIPGYTGADGNDSFVTVSYNGETELAVPYDAVCTIFLSQGGVVNLDLWDMWSFDPFGPDAKDVMQAVDDLDVYDISHQLEQMGYEPMVDENGEYVVASRKAHFDLEWEDLGDDAYEAALPVIPGYQGSYPDEVRVCSRPKDDAVWLFEMLIGVGDKQVPLYNYDFGIPYGGSADEMMDAVENLDPQDVASVLGDFGFAPDED